MDIHHLPEGLLMSVVICLPLIVFSVIALLLRKRPLSWILYGIGLGASVALLIAGNVFKSQFASSDLGKSLIQNVGAFQTFAELMKDPGYVAVLQKNPAAAFPIKLYYLTNWSVTIALVLLLVFAIAFLLILIVAMNKKREKYVRENLVSQYNMSFK